MALCFCGGTACVFARPCFTCAVVGGALRFEGMLGLVWVPFGMLLVELMCMSLIELVGPGHGTVPGTCESQVKVNCVEAGLVFLDACCCRILTFSWPREGVIGNFSALADAIDSDIIPVLSPYEILARARHSIYSVLTCCCPRGLSLFRGASITPITCSV